MRVVAGIETFGASEPLKELQKKFGFIPENIVVAARSRSLKRG
jgi:transketolase